MAIVVRGALAKTFLTECLRPGSSLVRLCSSSLDRVFIDKLVSL